MASRASKRRREGLAALLCVLVAVPAAAARIRLNWAVGYRAEYETNPYRFAPEVADDFESGAHNYRFPDVAARDDVDNEVYGRVSASLDPRGPWRLSGRARLGGHLHVRNSTNLDRWSFSLGGRAAHRGFGFLDLSYLFTPSTPVRPLADPDVPTGDGPVYRMCDYDASSFTAAVGRELFAGFSGEAHYRREVRYYNEFFTEYDTWLDRLGLELSRGFGPFAATFGYSFTWADARGYDEAGETRDDADESNSSYEQDEFSVGARWETRVFSRRVSLHGSADYTRRAYTTSESVIEAPSYAGRFEHRWSLDAGLVMPVSGLVSVEVGLGHSGRSVESSQASDFEDSRKYSTTSVTLGVVLEH